VYFEWNQPEHYSHAPALLVDIGSKSSYPLYRESKVQLVSSLETGDLVLAHHTIREVPYLFARKRRKIERDNLSVHSESGRGVFFQKEIRCLLFRRQF